MSMHVQVITMIDNFHMSESQIMSPAGASSWPALMIVLPQRSQMITQSSLFFSGAKSLGLLSRFKDCESRVRCRKCCNCHGVLGWHDIILLVVTSLFARWGLEPTMVFHLLAGQLKMGCR